MTAAAALAALFALVLGAIAYYQRRARKATARADTATRAAEVAADTVTAAADVAAARDAGAVLAEEIRLAPTTDDPAADRAELYRRVREAAAREGVGPPATVPDAPAASAGRDDATGHRR